VRDGTAAIGDDDGTVHAVEPDTTTGGTRRPARRILVTGAAGFIGRHVAEHLAAAGHQVTTTDIADGCSGPRGDLRDPGFRRDLLHAARPDVVVHAAALVPLTRDESGFTTTNALAAGALAADARAAGATRFVLIGSSAVYGAPLEHPITPTTPTRPIEPYGRSKLLAEQAVHGGWGGAGLTILRPRTVLGAGRGGIVGTLARWIREDLPLPLPDGGRHRLQLVSVDDVARLVEHVITHDVDGTWPAGAPGARNLDAEITALAARAGSASRIVAVPGPLFRLAARGADLLGLSPFTRWHYGSLGHDFAFDPAWTPAGFTYRDTNAEVLASVLDTTAARGTSPHTRTWETRALDRAVRTLARTTRAASRDSRRAPERSDTGTDANPRTGTRTVDGLLLAPLVRHPDQQTRDRALASLARHRRSVTPLTGLAMIAAAQLARILPLDERAGARRVAPPLARVLGPVLDLAGKLRAAHLSAAIGEPAPLTPPRRARTAPPPPRADLVVIGSGPGAAMLVHAALEGRRDPADILVLEAGRAASTPSERHHGLEHLLADFADGGAELCLSNPLTQIAQGRVVGGGSEVNSGFHHDLPARHRAAWCRALDIGEDEWTAAERDVRTILEVSPAPTTTGDSVIARGASALGHHHTPVERWRTYHQHGFHQHGMTRQVWARHPAVAVRADSTVVRIECTNPGHVVVRLADGGSLTARRVAVCAGAVNTPRLLHASGLVRRTDLSFSLHPMVRVVARCRETDAGRDDVDPFQAFTDDGYKYGGAVSTPSLLGAALGRPVDRDESAVLRSFYASFEPGGTGGFLPGPGGLLPRYRYSDRDRHRMRAGADGLASLLTAAGADVVTRPEDAAGHPSSVHVFGSLPYGGPGLLAGTSLVDADPRVGVYDASLLPGAPGVNPQGAVMTLALVLARRQLHL